MMPGQMPGQMPTAESSMTAFYMSDVELLEAMEALRATGKTNALYGRMQRVFTARGRLQAVRARRQLLGVTAPSIDQTYQREGAD